MGWFWADPVTPAGALIAPHPVPNANASPPPACPMHKTNSTSPSFPPRQDSASETTSSYPVKSPNHPLRASAAPPPVQSPQGQNESPSTMSKLNPLNYMPTLSNKREHSEQSISLPLSRETSSIPRGDADSNWEYPSPQQMYNAMLRKGNSDVPVDAVESMVAVHNFLNEGAWNEITEWEDIFGKGLQKGWEQCRKGEEGMAAARAKMATIRQRRQDLGVKMEKEELSEGPKLLRFMGRPGEMTPKARIMQALGKVFPERYGNEPPFDRHDWYVARPTASGTKEVRYVIDYYSDGVDTDGNPVFYLDIRPALDTPTAALERAMRWGGDVWHRASGASVRQEQSKK